MSLLVVVNFAGVAVAHMLAPIGILANDCHATVHMACDSRFNVGILAAWLNITVLTGVMHLLIGTLDDCTNGRLAR